MENEKHVSHFPTHGFVFISKTQKGGLAADRFAPAPGSFFDEKMLSASVERSAKRRRNPTRAIFRSRVRSPGLHACDDSG